MTKQTPIFPKVNAMLLSEAIEQLGTGASFTSNSLPAGAVLKFEDGDSRIVFPSTGSGYSFTPRAEHIAADWRKLEGWLNYA